MKNAQRMISIEGILPGFEHDGGARKKGSSAVGVGGFA
jgi:hypothetical protein